MNKREGNYYNNGDSYPHLEPCLTCDGRIEREFGVWNIFDQLKNEIPDQHLWLMFLLSTLLRFPEDDCENLLLVDERSLVLCDNCSELVLKAYEAHQQILSLERELELVKESVEYNLRQSFCSRSKGSSGFKEMSSARGSIRDFLKKGVIPGKINSVKMNTPSHPSTSPNSTQSINSHGNNENFAIIHVSPYPCNFVETIIPSSAEGTPLTMKSEDSRDTQRSYDNTNYGGASSGVGVPLVFTVPVVNGDDVVSNYFPVSVPSQPPPPPVTITRTTPSSSTKSQKGSSRFYKCSQCQFQTHSYSVFYEHNNKHKIQPTTASSTATTSSDSGGKRGDIIKCEYCSKIDEKKRIYRHMKEAHASELGEKLMGCHLCSKTFLSPHGLQVHIRNAHKGGCDGVGTHVKKLICTHCNHQYPDDKQLKLHMRSTHAPLYKYLCDLCEAMYKSPSGLKAHMGVVHSKLKVKCQYCHIEFGCDKYLRDHLTRYCKKVSWNKK